MRALRNLLTSLLGLAIIFGASAEAAPQRYALVIGNSDYDGDGVLRPGIATGSYEDDLRNPRNDANLIGRTLEDLGFKVTRVMDADREGMQTALLDFANLLDQAPDADAVIYYSGHGLQVDGSNYLVPIRAKLVRTDLPSATSRVRAQILSNLTIPADEILNLIGDRPNGMTVLVLDACRDNPWDRRVRGVSRGALTRGLERMSAPEGAIVAFSTKANDVAPDGDGDNSPYALSLSHWMKQPGIYAEQVFKQVGIDLAQKGGQQPDLETALRINFCFNSCPGDSQIARSQVRAPADVPHQAGFAASSPFGPPDFDVPSLATGTTPQIRTYMIFFAYASTKLTEKAVEVAQEVATDFNATRGTKGCLVEGYVDGAEAKQGFERAKKGALSLRRAEAVKSYMTKFGIAKIIEVDGKGTSNPLVPTAAGAREAQNRRTLISCG